jgi:TldD protein
MEDFLRTAVDAALSAGATYADARAVHNVTESLSVRGPVVENVDRSDSLGFGVRVIADGAWGFAASWNLDDEASTVARTAVEVARAGATATSVPVDLVPEPAHSASYSTPVETDPFEVALEDKVGLLAAAAEQIERDPGVRLGRATMDLAKQKTWFASSEGSAIDQTLVHTGAGIEASAVANGEVQTRSYPASFRGDLAAGGYEVVERMDLPGNAARTADEAAALLRAPDCPEAVTTLVLDGHQVMLQVHESIGHATELDRVLGMEASFAGTSFLSLEDLGGYRFGSDVVNVTADATVPGGIGTFGYDDEGVAAQRVDLIRDGILVGYQTSRETAARIGGERSNGTMRAEGWENFPLIRMTNINLLPGSGSLEDLLANVDSGVYMATNKSWSIDDKRKNFQFGCEIAWEIKKGRLARMLRNPRYTGITPIFWSSCEAVAGEELWRMWGTPNCGKGQPGQTVRVGHGTAPALFRNVATGYAQ